MDFPSMNACRHEDFAIIAISLTIASAGCGAGSSPTSPPNAPSPAVVAEGSWELAYCGSECGFLFRAYFDITSRGTIDVTVDYTHADTDLVFWLTRGVCDSDMSVPEQCQPIATCPADGKPRELTVTSLPAGRYRLALVNFGPRREEGRYRIVFTANGMAASRPPKTRGDVDPDHSAWSALEYAVGRVRKVALRRISASLQDSSSGARLGILISSLEIEVNNLPRCPGFDSFTPLLGGRRPLWPSIIESASAACARCWAARDHSG